MSGWLRSHFSRTAALAATLGLLSTISACGQSGPQPRPHGAGSSPASPASFLSSYVHSGRVERPDQGGDTVSEGQAYGLLLAQAAGDATAFRRIWQWTRAHLQRGDGLFASHANAAGRVTDPQSASDADVLIAWALVRATGPGAAGYRSAGRRVANAVLSHEVTNGPDGRPILAAGPWATGRPASLNPSYWSLTALDGLASLTGDSRWQRIATGAVSLTRQLTQSGRMLPPDWAELTSAGQLRSEAAPSGTAPQAQYGLDAQRTVVWFATSCDAGARALAAQWWPMLRASGASGASALRLNGTILNPSAAPLPFVAAASAARAAGDQPVTTSLLSRADQQERSYPTYYGAAWSALGPALLTGGTLARC